MDLIYADENRIDQGVMDAYELDMAYGSDENNFTCTIDRESHCCTEGFFLYVEGEEYGGIVDKVKVNTEKDEITYSGRTWHGILEKKIICPEDGQDYAVFDGEANKVLQTIIDRIDLGDLFEASTEDTGIQIQAFQMDRYIDAYTGICKMLKDADAKLNIIWKNKKVVLSAQLRQDYSQDEEFNTAQVDFTIEKNYRPVNHIICLGQGDLKNRAVIHLFCDENGGIQPYAMKDIPLQDSDYILGTSRKVMDGEDEVVEILDYPNAEITENYILMSTQPSDWKKNSTAYFFQDDKDKFKEVEEVEVGYKLQKIQPYDWAVNFSEYYVKSGNTYKNVEGQTVMQLQTSQPSDWGTKYEDYFTKNGSSYPSVKGVEKTTYRKQAKKPSDWSKNYKNYFEFYSDGVTSKYQNVSGITKYRYVLQTRKPTDWADSCTSYYKKKKKGGYENVSKTKKKKAPAWRAKTYYTRISYEVPPAWKANHYYTEVNTVSAPAWSANKYYTQNDNVAPSWSQNKYYSETDETVAPAWTANKYFKMVTDQYAVMVQSAVERIEEAHQADDMKIALEETEQVYDVGDIVGTSEETTGITAVQEVCKKIIKINNDDVTITYEVN
ncbi:hypothetical protein DWY46_16445 [Blautia obeum]|uniref:Uncharacterized protein n=1 Tax=Blautia obeum TaxID=40520 RepID=A0A412ELW4_9FIRM|nr:hypothetical protein [Blautia obeum]RGR45776.1 hypothetical protein DWY46_16445 [Blautia obeum]